jgi:hypothetical protein
MTFNNQRGKKNSAVNDSLVYSDFEVENKLKKLNITVFELEKVFEDIYEYHKRVSGLSEKEYAHKKIYIHDLIDNVPNSLKDVDRTVVQFENLNVKDYTLQTKINDSLKTINSRLRPKQQNLSKLIYEITEKEKLRNDYNRTPMSEAEYERISSLDNNGSKELLFRESKASLKDIEFNDQILKARENELLHVQKVSSQIKEMTNYMNIATQDQGLQLSNINFIFNLLFFKYLFR